MNELSETERKRRKEVLAMILKDLDRPVRQPFPRAEAERQQAAKEEAKEDGRELLTPRAACKLFQKSPPTVRRAVSERHVEAPYTLDATAKPVALIRLESAVSYWGKPDSELLDKMRENGHTLGVNGLSFNVLSPSPLITLRNREELE